MGSPADSELLLASARTRRAPGWLIDALHRLPAGRVFQSLEELATALCYQRRVHLVIPRSDDGVDATRRHTGQPAPSELTRDCRGQLVAQAGALDQSCHEMRNAVT